MSIRLEQAVAHIITDRTRRWDKGRFAVTGTADISEHIKVLRQKQQVHDILGR